MLGSCSDEFSVARRDFCERLLGVAALPPIASRAETEADEASARKRRREESASDSSAPIFGSQQYVSQLNRRVEEFLLGLVTQVVRDAGESSGGLSEQEAASMIKGQLRKMLDS